MENTRAHDGGIKKRAGRACASCRSRKVRCDVVRNGPPCTNCHLDLRECIVPRSKRRKVSKASKSAGPAVPSMGASGRSVPEIIPQQAGQHCREDRKVSGNEVPCTANGRHVSIAEESLAPSRSTTNCLPDAVCSSLPAFIKPLSARLDQADLRYLYEKGAFSLPTDAFRNVCLARYLEFTHPLLPLLDKAQVLSILDNENNGKSPMALLLFHAVMCSGVTFMENDIIKLEGFASKHSARLAYFNRAKVLFDCNTEPDRLIAVQAALLMSTWYPGREEKQDPWYWTGTAISLAYSIGLHLQPDESRFDVPEQHLRRRVWWCTFAREQKNALALGRPPRITYHGVSMLTPEDFVDNLNVSIGVHPAEVMRSVSVIKDRETQDALAGLCIEHMKLCVEGCNREDYNEYPPSVPSSCLNKSAQDFTKWYREMPVSLHYNSHAVTSSQCDTKPGRSLIVHKATVHIVYYVAVSALYRLKALSPSSTWCNRVGEQHVPAQRILRHAAWELTSVNWDLYQSGLSPYSSTTAVGSISAAMLIHLLDTKSPIETVRRAAIQRIQECKQFLLSLRGAYGTEIEALEYFKAAERHDIDFSISEEQQTPRMRPTGTSSSRNVDQQLRDSDGESLLMRPHYSSPAAAEFQDACGLESPPLMGIDEMFWQSSFEGLSSYDLFGFNIPPYDQMVSPNTSMGLDMARMFAES